MAQKVLDALTAKFARARSSAPSRSTATRPRGSSATSLVAVATLAARRPGDGVRCAGVRAPRSTASTGSPLGMPPSAALEREQAALRGLLPAALAASTATASGSRSRVPEDDARCPSLAGAVARVRLARARDVRHVRHPVRRSPRPAPHLHVRGVRRLSAAQGLPEGEAPAARAPRRPADQSDQATEEHR